MFKSYFMMALLTVSVSLLTVPGYSDEKNSPERIVFWERNRLAEMKPDGSEFRYITDEIDNAAIDDPRLSPDGNSVAYGVRKYNENGIASSVEPAQIRVKRLNDSRGDVVVSATGHIWSWSPDSKMLAVTKILSVSSGRAVVQNSLVNFQTGEEEALDLPEGHFITDWSRDGKWFCTTSVREKKDGDDAPVPIINLVAADGSIVRPIKASVGGAMGRLSPDGKNVLFPILNSENDTSTLFTADVEGDDRHAVADGVNVQVTGFCWAPDGTQIAYTYKVFNGKPSQVVDTESFLEVVGWNGRGSRILHEENVPAGTIQNTRAPLILSSPDWR